MTKCHFCLTLLSIALAGCTPAKTLVPDDALVVWNGTVIDATGRLPIPDGIVVVRGHRITAIGKAGDFVVPRGIKIVDAMGGTILPGIINSHTHGTGNPTIRREFLVDGVTTVCDVGASLGGLSAFEQASVPEGPAARVFWAGPIVTAPGGYPGPAYGSQYSYEVATPEEARKAVADLVDRGASMIKIALAPGDPHDPWPVLDLERARAVVEEAHSRGLLVRAHVFEPYLVEDLVLPAGIDVIEHSPFPILSEEEERSVFESPIPRTHLFDVVAPDFVRLLAAVADRNVVMVPTLTGHIGGLYRKPDRSRKEQVVMDVHVEAVSRFHASGGVVALGNDYGADVGTRLGMPLTEMTLLLGAGLSPMEVIEAGTRHAAFVCGQGDHLGTLETGKLADIIVVDGDPLSDLQSMERLLAVIQGGEVAHVQDRVPT